MMTRRTARSAFLSAVVLLAGRALAGAPPASETLIERPHDVWVLGLEYETPQPLVLEDTDQGLTYYWYMIYRVSNPDDPQTSKRAMPTDIRIEIELKLKGKARLYRDVRDVVAERRIKAKVAKDEVAGRKRVLYTREEMQRGSLKLPGAAKAPQALLGPGKSREGVAIFRIGPTAAEFDTMAVFVRGLAARSPLPAVYFPKINAEVADPASNDEGRATVAFAGSPDAESPIVPADALDKLGILPQGKREFTLAKDTREERSFAAARITFQGHRVTCPVVFGQKDDPTLLDSRTLAKLGLALDPLRKQIMLLKVRERVLHVGYRYVASKWTKTRELRFDDEKWDVEENPVSDAGAEKADVEKSEKEIEEIEKWLKKLEQQLKELPPKKEKKPGAGASAAPRTSGIAAAARRVGRRDPALIALLRAKADRCRTARAAFAEIIGAGDHRQSSTGTLYLRNDKCFAMDRSIAVGTPRALKERRVFDGKALWIHTTAKGIGETVRKWIVARTKKEWQSLDGRPGVDFATVVNPARARRLFADDLTRQGAEILGGQLAHVLDVTPGKRYAALLSSPLAGELLGQAAGRRTRFWISGETGLQLRMRIYGEDDQAVASFECTDVDLGAHVEPAQFIFRTPGGVEVTDMNSAVAVKD